MLSVDAQKNIAYCKDYIGESYDNKLITIIVPYYSSGIKLFVNVYTLHAENAVLRNLPELTSGGNVLDHAIKNEEYKLTVDKYVTHINEALSTSSDMLPYIMQ
jgi:hypothetical protein